MVHRNSLLTSVALVATALAVTDAAATAQRTFVASYGAAANTAFNCSIAKPCRAFSEAIGVTNSGGEVIVLDSAGYGPVTIAQSVSIIAPPGIYGGISVFPGLTGITVNAPGATVVLRGLSINGQGGGPGVDVQAASRVRIESCVVSHLTGDGIDDSATGAEMIVLDTIVRDNTGQGIQLHADGSAVLDHVRSEHNGIQGFAMEPASSEASATVSDSVFSYNGANGVIATSGPGTQAFVQVERSVMSNNGSSGFFAFTSSSGGTTTAMLSRNAINRNTANGVLLSAPSVGFDGFTIVSLSENAINANQIGLHLLGAHSTAFTSLNTANSNPTNDVDCDVDGRVASTHNNGVSSALKGSCITVYSSW